MRVVADLSHRCVSIRVVVGKAYEYHVTQRDSEHVLMPNTPKAGDPIILYPDGLFAT